MNKYMHIGTILLVSVLTGCATKSTTQFEAFEPDDLNELVKTGLLVQKTDSFLVLNDSSSSMRTRYEGVGDLRGTKFDVEKNLLNRFNMSIPDIPLSSALRSFGFGPCLDWGATKLNQPLQTYSTSSFDSAIGSLECAGGGTPLARAVTASKQDLTSAPGNISVIVLSDGMDEVSPIPAAKALKAQYGDRLCIYSVWVGNKKDVSGKRNLLNLTNLAKCGFSTQAEAIATPQGMADFVKRVFFKPGTPEVVDNDEDKDGVVDSKDKCPGTPRGAIVDKDGCWAFHGLLFDFDSDKVKSQYDPMIQNAVKVMRLNPELTVEIQGHTDSIGSDDYNQKLSERRAKSVKNELVRQGIDSRRMSAVGFGESQPVASNDTDEGRAYNRRVTYIRTDK